MSKKNTSKNNVIHGDQLIQSAFRAYQEGRYPEALEHCQKALALVPTRPDLWTLVGIASRRLGQTHQAIAAYQTAIIAMPEYIDASSNLANIYKDIGQYAEAARLYRHALAFRPAWPETRNALAETYRLAGLSAESIQEASRAIEESPTLTEAYNTLGNVLLDQGYSSKAEYYYWQGIIATPGFTDIYTNLGNVYKRQGLIPEGVRFYQRALTLSPGKVGAYGNLLLALQYDTTQTLASIKQAHMGWDQVIGAQYRAFWKAHNNPKDPQRRLKIGYVSPDLGRHPIGYFLSPVLNHHDRNQIEVYCYSGRTVEDDITLQLRANSDHWRVTVGVEDHVLAEQIRQDGIDILIDLAGHTSNNRLTTFAMKPAPIQMTWAGYVGTTGLSTIDYLISDAYETPLGVDEHYVEKILRLPDGYVCYAPSSYAPEVSPLPALARGYVTFGCFNNLTKVNEGVIDLWAKILQAVPNSRIVLRTYSLTEPTVQKRYLEYFTNRGISPDRVDLLGSVDHTQLLPCYHDIDIALDPFPYSGGLTTLESLWMGVPVITLRGERFCSLHSTSHLTVVGVSELIAETQQDYLDKAVHWAKQRDRLANLRANLRPSMQQSPACDGARFTKNLEKAFREIWRQYCGHEVSATIPSTVATTPPPAATGNPASSESSEILERVRRDPMQGLVDAFGYYQKENFVEAEKYCDAVLQFMATRPDAWTLRGALYRHQEQFEKSVACHQKAIQLMPDYADAHNNLGTALKEQLRYEESINAYKGALRHNPSHVDAHLNLASIYLELGDPDKAIVIYEQGLKHHPGHIELAWNLALAQLTGGDLLAGFRGYELRWQARIEPLQLPTKEWQGEDLHDIPGNRLYLYTEQGYGDVIHCARYIPMVAARGAKVILELRPELVPLFKTMPGIHQIVPRGENPPVFDYHCALLSLPWIFGTTLETIPRQIPYLTAEPSVVTRWQQRLSSLPGLKIGLIWGGNPNVKNDKRRSPGLEPLLPLLQTPGVTFISLQKGKRREDLEQFFVPDSLVDLGDEIQDFADSAAVMQQLDLLITSDTSTAHLGGAVGCPTWVLLHIPADWRWLIGREDSPWYPTMRLFRQPTAKDWPGVVARLRQELTAFIAGDRSRLLPQSPAEASVSELGKKKSEQPKKGKKQKEKSAKIVPFPGSQGEKNKTSSILPKAATAIKTPSSPVMIQQNQGASVSYGGGYNQATDQQLAQALIAYQRKDMAAALSLCQEVLKAAQERADAWTLLGMIYRAAGQMREAIASYQHAIHHKPDFPDAHYNLAHAYRSLGLRTEAIASYRTAIQYRSQVPEMWSTLADLLREDGRLDEAEQACHEALKINPNAPNPLMELGNVFQGRGDLEKAVAYYQAAVRAKPDLIPAHRNLGITLKSLHRYQEALQVLQYALTVDPNYALTYSGLCGTYCALTQFAEGIVAGKAAVILEPNSAECWGNLARTYWSMRDYDNASPYYRYACLLNPKHSDLHDSYAVVLQQQKRYDEAFQYYQIALQLNDKNAKVYGDIGQFFADQSQHEKALQYYQKFIELDPGDAGIYSNYLFTLNYTAGISKETLLKEHIRWSELHEVPRMCKIRPHQNPRDPNRKLKIGYVSPDLANHPVVNYMEPVFEHHDRNQFEIYAYAQVANPDFVTARVQQKVDHWLFTTPIADDGLAEKIRQDGIDILVDLAGHTGNHRLLIFAQKPAPVQVTYLGYGATTGMKTLDYYLWDEWLVPSGEERFYTEQIWRLPETYRCFRPIAESPEINELPALQRGYITFASFNNYLKITQTAIDLWARILQEIPTSRLMIVTHLPPEQVYQRFRPHGLEESRIQVVDKRPMLQYLKLHQEVDISLDSFPHTGATTTYHSLWMGVPVVSMAGDRPVSRTTIGIEGPLGLSEWVADSPDEYIAVAKRVSSDFGKLNDLRLSLRPRMKASVLTQEERFTRHLEAAYREMWRIWCQKGS